MSKAIYTMATYMLNESLKEIKMTEQLDAATELKYYKTLYLIYLINRYEGLLMSDGVEYIKKYLDFRRKQIIKIYNELFDPKIESHNIDWLDIYSVNKLTQSLMGINQEYEVLLGIDARYLMEEKNE